MIYTIYKGWHHAIPPKIGLFTGDRIIKKVRFNQSAKYDIGNDNNDVNKLFGIGYFPHHHKESARFGWNYNQQENLIRIFAYCYVGGIRNIELLSETGIYNQLILMLDIIDKKYSFTVLNSGKSEIGGCDIPFSHDKRIGYKLGCYFGGDRVAPHKIKIEII